MEQPRSQKWDVSETETWFADRDWVAAGEKFRYRRQLSSQQLKHPAPDSQQPELTTTAAASA